VSAREYLVSNTWAAKRGLRVYNFCRTYGYQTLGYYVSLLAAARSHRALPTVETLQDLRLAPVVRIVSQELDALIAKSFARLRSAKFELSVYFGHNLSRRYEPLARALYQQFPVPLLRASFEKRGREWRLSSVRPIATSEIPDDHRTFVIEAAEEHFDRKARPARAKRTFQYDMAILHEPGAEDAPSDDKALRKFIKAAADVGIDAELIELDEASDIAEYDALFIRQTTYVNGPTYRLSRRAATEGLVVIDDPTSILRCSNKVFLAELFERNKIPQPRTFVAHEEAIPEIASAVGLPCVLKRPDSAFSRGVVRVDTEEELREKAKLYLADSELVVAQSFMPSDFDWRVGVLDGKPLFVCRYHMARGHWQIVTTDSGGKRTYGKVESVPIEQAPARAVEIGVRAASLIGDGLYGVDIKESQGEFYVMEVNDNPNVESGEEDGAVGDVLYQAVMQWFRVRLDKRGDNGGPRSA